MKDKGTSSRVIIIALIIFGIIGFIAVTGIKKGATGQESGNIVEKASISKAIQKAPFEVIVPKSLYQELKGKEAEVINGAMFSIEDTGLAYKAAPFVDVKADVLGIYEAPKTEEEFYAKDSKLKTSYIRYRQFEKATALNWVCNNTMYGLWIGEVQTLDHMISFLEINLEDYDKEIKSFEQEQNEAISINDIDFERYHSKTLKASFDMPVVSSDVAVQSGDNFITITYDFKPAFTIMRNNNIKMESTQEYHIEELGNGFTLQYFTENQFAEIDRAYKDYEILLKSVDKIKDSFEVDKE